MGIADVGISKNNVSYLKKFADISIDGIDDIAIIIDGIQEGRRIF